MSPLWRYVLTPQELRDMRRLDDRVGRRIFLALDRYVAGHKSDVRKLQGRNQEWRLRVGDWRIRFRPDTPNGVLVVLRVLHRSQAYRE